MTDAPILSTSTLSVPINPRPLRKPKAPHQSNTAQTRPIKLKRKPIPLPPPSITSSHPTSRATKAGGSKPPTLPIKTLQGLSTPRTDGHRDGYGREVIFITRRAGLGMLIGRCRGLVVDEGYTRLTFHALSAAIPQALLLLHSLLDILPYPTGPKGMWYEIRTGSVECVDEVRIVDGETTNTQKKSTVITEKTKNVEKGSAEGLPQEAMDIEIDTGRPPNEDDDGDEDDFLVTLDGIGGVEEKEPERKTRIKSSIQIDLHISSRPRPKNSSLPNATHTMSIPASTTRSGTAKTGNDKVKSKNRPSKKRRNARAAARRAEKGEDGHGIEDKEEAMMNTASGELDEEDALNGETDGMEVDEEEEEIEEVEQVE